MNLEYTGDCHKHGLIDGEYESARTTLKLKDCEES